jgi:hypothetical protein
MASMSAVAIPIAIELGRTLLPVAKSLVVKLVDKMIGSKNGDKKRTLAVQIMDQILRGVESANPGVGLPQGPEVGDIIQEEWARLNSRGELNGHNTQISMSTPSPQVADVVDSSLYLSYLAYLRTHSDPA